jgi:hypothetical protein
MKKFFVSFIMFLVLSASVWVFGEADKTILSLSKATSDQIARVDNEIQRILNKREWRQNGDGDGLELIRLSELRKSLVESYFQLHIMRTSPNLNNQ